MIESDLSFIILGAAYEVRKTLGRFLYEDVYEQALQAELVSQGIKCERQVYLPVFYKNIKLDKSFKIDLVVDGRIPIELKTQESMGTPEFSQIMSYMVFGNFKFGYLMNFASDDFCTARIPSDMYMDKGIYRIFNNEFVQ